MGFIPPPEPLTHEEFDKRWNAGARTLQELDPAFCEWYEHGQFGSTRSFLLTGAFVIICFIVALLALL